jgi:hypothetical protein
LIDFSKYLDCPDCKDSGIYCDEHRVCKDSGIYCDEHRVEVEKILKENGFELDNY